MNLRPGVNLIRGLTLLTALSPLAFLWPPILTGMIVAAICLGVAAIIDARRVRPLLDACSVSRRLPTVASRSVAFAVRWDLSNASSSDVRGFFRDELPALARPQLVVFAFTMASRDSTVCETLCKIPRRGVHRFGPAWIRVEGPWRLMEASRSTGASETVRVLPETFASRERLVQDAGASQRLVDAVRQTRHSGPGTEFESLRPFREGDDPRRIDWRSTARHRELIVRRHQVERNREVMIVLDDGRMMGAETGRGCKLDFAVDAALNLARVALDGGDRCGAAAYDSLVRRFLPPRSGPAALRGIVDGFFDLEVRWHESNFLPMLAELRRRQSKRSFLVVLSDLTDPETASRLSASLNQLQCRHVVLFAALRTPLLKAIERENVVDAQSAARKATAMRLQRDRSRALHALRRSGVHVLDVEPEELTVPLINRFVELRRRNTL
jgi:uncharacterized protein (DUF58 family)